MILIFLIQVVTSFPTQFYQKFDVCPVGRLVLEINRGQAGKASFV